MRPRSTGWAEDKPGLETLMRIVDAQIRLWGQRFAQQPGHRQVTSFTIEEAVRLMDEGGLDAGVIVILVERAVGL